MEEGSENTSFDNFYILLGSVSNSEQVKDTELTTSEQSATPISSQV
jgi:hypothetical protein